MQYRKMSQVILENIGGVENITNVTHCATRLRINYKNKNLVNVEAIKTAENVIGVVSKTNQIQIIIGPKVTKAYHDFLEVSKWVSKGDTSSNKIDDDSVKKDVLYYMNVVGNFCAQVFMPIIPALIVGGLILAIRNLLINYFGVPVQGGTAEVMLSIFRAAFNFLPIYLGYNIAKTLKMQPIMGALLGCILVSPSISGVEGLSFLGVSIPTVSYQGSIMPVMLGCFFMYYVDKVLDKIIPEIVVYFLKPLLTMIIVVPITLIVLGPIGTQLSGGFTSGIVWFMNHTGPLAMPLLAMIYPYMVMFGLDKALAPVGIELVATLGYNPLTLSAGFISNICIGATALAVAMAIKKDKERKGMFTSFAITALCGVTEPAFYGALITRPVVLIGTAIGALSGGLVGGIFGLVNYVHGGCPGFFTFLFFLNPDGTFYNFILSFVVAGVSIAVSFIATTIIIKKTKLIEKELKVSTAVVEDSDESELNIEVA